MKIQLLEVPGLAHYSYVLSSGGRAVVIDPKRDVDTYLDFAAQNGLKMTHILETHIHADYASGARELAERSGAELWASGHDEGEDFQYRFPHHDFRDGEALELGETRIVAWHTPGHTPEHLAFLIYEHVKSDPTAMFSGDFVFAGSLGRPDLLGEGAKQRLAEQMYKSVQRLASLPDSLEIYPAHGAGSMCGAGMSGMQQTTLGYERRSNRFLLEHDRGRFVDTLLSTVPPFPDYYRC